MVYNYGYGNRMSYKKRNNYRKRRYNYNKSVSYKANKALSLARKAQNQKELKFAAHNYTTPVTDTGAIVSLSTVGQGDTNNSREGNVIYPTSSRVRCYISLNASASTSMIRIIIFKFRPNTTPTVTDVLQTGDVTSFKTDSERFLSKILYDKTHILSDGSVQQKMITITNKFRKYTMGFDEGTTQANYNALWALLISDESTNAVGIDFEQRLYFKDS